MAEPASEDIELLNRLLERARSGVSVMQVYLRGTDDDQLRQGLRDVIVSEARVCSTVYRHIQELGGQPSSQVAPLVEGTLALSEPGPQMEVLARLLEESIGLLQSLLGSGTDVLRDFLDDVLVQQQRHLKWAQGQALRHGF